MTEETILEEPCVVGIISWLQEHAPKYFNADKKDKTDTKSKASSARASKFEKFSRLWIYSHHIYSKIKRKNILDLAGELKLTGFCLPGKPGVICVEGDGELVSEWWYVVRYFFL